MNLLNFFVTEFKFLYIKGVSHLSFSHHNNLFLVCHIIPPMGIIGAEGQECQLWRGQPGLTFWTSQSLASGAASGKFLTEDGKIIPHGVVVRDCT